MMNTYETDSAQPNDFKADCSFQIPFQIQIDQMCQQHLIESTNQMDLRKGINVCFTHWDTNNVEEDTAVIGKTIQFIKIILSSIKETSLKDFEYTDTGLNITLKKDNTEVTIHFKQKSLKTDFIFGKMEPFLLECKKNNINVNELCFDGQFPLYVIMIDTNNPHGGELIRIQETDTILRNILSFIIERYGEDSFQ